MAVKETKHENKHGNHTDGREKKRKLEGEILTQIFTKVYFDVNTLDDDGDVGVSLMTSDYLTARGHR